MLTTGGDVDKTDSAFSGVSALLTSSAETPIVKPVPPMQVKANRNAAAFLNLFMKITPFEIGNTSFKLTLL